ncbi:MAG: EAL domain-containing protein [Spirochaetia bacterium]|nr:EAL domain-containing protein [Spirochaetia bacterium]MDD7269491.1 EAL domain-containing protein [Treponema sp.]MDY4984943.1 EAL domain-containing protein [Treponema sp.]
MILRKVIKGPTNGIFFLVVLLSVLATISDIVSDLTTVPPTVRFWAVTFYFLISVAIPLLYSVYIYSSVGLLQYVGMRKRLWFFLSLPMITFMGILIVNFFTNCAFTVTASGVYIRGQLQPVLIACSLLYILFGIGVIIRWHYIIPFSTQIGLFSLFPIMSASLIVQQIHQGLEVTMFGLSVSELIISFTVQRNGENYNRDTGDKNFETALEDFQKVYLSRQTVYTIFIKISNYTTIRHYLGSKNYQNFIKMVSNDVRAIEHKSRMLCESYYLDEATYAVKIENKNRDRVVAVAEEIADLLKQPFVVDDITLTLDARICVACLPDDIVNVDELMNFRINFHKKLVESNDVVKLWEFSETKEFKIKNEMDEIIKRAIKNKAFKIYYQPIYSTKLKKFVSAEALIRLEDKKYGFISPEIFITAAEENGSIHQIGDFVIDSVCHFVSRPDFSQLGLKYIELNLSVAQCVETDLVEKLDNCVSKYGISSDLLNLEITETVGEGKPEILDYNIKTLYKKGYRFSLDDYGTGYSNVKRLTELPLDIVKLDKSFVDEMDKPQMWSVIVNTVNMFKEMNKIILVEGVEDQKTLDAFINLGCDYIQGYYFSKPIPEDEFVDFLMQHN